MHRYYKRPESDSTFVLAVRDRKAESLPEAQRTPRAVSDVELCSQVEELFLTAKRDQFKTHPELKHGAEIRCENQDEADHLSGLMRERYGRVIKYKVRYPGAPGQSATTPEASSGPWWHRMVWYQQSMPARIVWVLVLVGIIGFAIFGLVSGQIYVVLLGLVSTVYFIYSMTKDAR
jgi:hypothetical protein